MSSPLDAPLLVSVPPWELAGLDIPASLFGRETLQGAELSPRLAAALQLIDRSRPAGSPLRFVARPEIFTDGATLDWLKARIGDVEDHLALSDGSSVKLLPGLRNHVFFYGLGRRADSEALARLERRAPEVLAQVETQVNTALAFRWNAREIAPPTIRLGRRNGQAPPEVELRRLFLNRNTVADSAARMMAAPPVDIAALHFAALTYVRLSGRGLMDNRLTRALAGEIAAHYVDPSRAALFVLPQTRGAPSDLQDRLDALAAGLIAGGCRTPLTPAANLLVATEDLGADALAWIADTRRLVVDDGDDFWRLPPSFQPCFAETTVFAQRKRHRRAAFEALLREGYGERMRIAWTSKHTVERPS
jgi:hypothetical protein